MPHSTCASGITPSTVGVLGHAGRGVPAYKVSATHVESTAHFLEENPAAEPH
jgi:hypothetical protein